MFALALWRHFTAVSPVRGRFFGAFLTGRYPARRLARLDRRAHPQGQDPGFRSHAPHDRSDGPRDRGKAEGPLGAGVDRDPDSGRAAVAAPGRPTLDTGQAEFP